MEESAINVYPDGSAKPNPGRGGFGVVLVFPFDSELDPIEFRSDAYEETTNNLMELRGLIKGLQLAEKNADRCSVSMIVAWTDSRHVRDGWDAVTSRPQDQWRRHDGGPLANKKVWQQALALKRRLLKSFRVEVRYIERCSTPETIRADELSKQSRKSQILRKDLDFVRGKLSKNPTPEARRITSYPAPGKESVVYIENYKPVGNNDYRVVFHVLYDDGEFEGRYVAHLPADRSNEISRYRCYAATITGSETYAVFETLERLPGGCPGGPESPYVKKLSDAT